MDFCVRDVLGAFLSPGDESPAKFWQWISYQNTVLYYSCAAFFTTFYGEKLFESASFPKCLVFSVISFLPTTAPF